jgi:hypothetical protein
MFDFKVVIETEKTEANGLDKINNVAPIEPREFFLSSA